MLRDTVSSADFVCGDTGEIEYVIVPPGGSVNPQLHGGGGAGDEAVGSEPPPPGGQLHPEPQQDSPELLAMPANVFPKGRVDIIQVSSPWLGFLAR